MLMARHFFTIVLCVIIFLFPQTAAAEAPRVALVIGNGDYTNVDKLQNAPIDASQVATNLRKLGYVVVDTPINKTGEELRRVVQKFKEVVKRGASVALVYYAGHGVEINGRTFLLGTDVGAVDVLNGEELLRDTLELNGLVEGIQEINAGVTLAFVDACRNELPKRRSLSAADTGAHQSRGLGRDPMKKGDYMIAYATSRSATALDGGASFHSPFTEAFLKYMMVPQLPLDKLLDNVTEDVLKSTKQTQRPTVQGSKTAAMSALSINPAVTFGQAALDGGPTVDKERRQCDEHYRNAVMSQDKVNSYKTFLDKCPQHPSSAKIEQDWNLELERLDCDRVQGPKAAITDMQQYLRRYPGGICEITVRSLLQRKIAEVSAPPPKPSQVAINIPSVTRTPDFGLAPTPAPQTGAPGPVTGSLQENSPSNAPSLKKLSGKYVEGEGYRTYTASSYGQCERMCQDDDKCQMIEFYRPENKCNLYAHTHIAGSSKEADTGIKQGAGIKQASVQALPPSITLPTMTRYANRYVEGDGYKTTYKSSYAECEAQCLEDTSCQQMEFYKPERKCNLFSSTRKMGKAITADVATKN